MSSKEYKIASEDYENASEEIIEITKNRKIIRFGQVKYFSSISEKNKLFPTIKKDQISRCASCNISE